MSETLDRPLSALFAALSEYCGRHNIGGRGFHEFDGPEKLKIKLNATGEERENVPPFHAVFFNEGGWPVALIHPFGGEVINAGWGDNPAYSEDRLITLLSESPSPAGAE